MTWTATGTYSGETFELTWDDELGTLAYSRSALGVDLGVLEGERFVLPPVGPAYLLDLTDPVTVVTAISALGRYVRFTGDVPQCVEDGPANRIY